LSDFNLPGRIADFAESLLTYTTLFAPFEPHLPAGRQVGT